MQASLRTVVCSAFCLGWVVACGSQGVPPTAATAASSAEHGAATTPTKAPVAATAAASEDGAAETEPAPEPAAAPASDGPGDGLRKASRPPVELITGGNVVYVFNFKESAAGARAQESCQRENADDARAQRECLEKARARVPVESVRFVKDKFNQYWWVTYNRYKGNLLKWHRIQFVPGKETDSTVSLTLVGKDKGIAPLARVPHSLSVNLPNDYSIVIDDPEFGAMAYDAKIGLVED